MTNTDQVILRDYVSRAAVSDVVADDDTGGNVMVGVLDYTIFDAIDKVMAAQRIEQGSREAIAWFKAWCLVHSVHYHSHIAGEGPTYEQAINSAARQHRNFILFDDLS